MDEAGAVTKLEYGDTFGAVVGAPGEAAMATLSCHRGGERTPMHSHAGDHVCVVISGGFAETTGKGTDEWRTGDYVVHDAAAAHADRFGSAGATCLNLHFAPGGLRRRPPAGGRCPLRARLAADELALEIASRIADGCVVESLAAEFLGALERRPVRADDDGWLARVIEAICDVPGRRRTLRELARLAGRHPVHVAQTFRARTGLSVGAFQRRRRLIGLSLALLHDREPLAALAAAFGYCDQSHMSREFRAAAGVSPGRFRRALHQDRPRRRERWPLETALFVHSQGPPSALGDEARLQLGRLTGG